MIIKSLIIFSSFLSEEIRCDQNTFDYIVVGAGPAGSMVATELARHGHETLLIEAGSDLGNYNTTVPAFLSRAWEDPELSWEFNVNYYGEKTKLRQNMFYPRGSGIGGSSLINAMINIYPHSIDFKRMVNLTRDDNWNEANFRQYLNSIKLLPSTAKDNNINSDKWIDRHFLPLKGFQKSKQLTLDWKYLGLDKLLVKPTINRLAEFDINGYDSDQHPNIDTPHSFIIPSNINYDQSPPVRSTVKEYVEMVLKNSPNLTVWPNTLVTKVLLENKAAIGVEYMPGKYLYRANVKARQQGLPSPPIQQVLARKEVILSGGVYNSPQLLLLSGIGDPEHLKALGITPQVNLPGVGKNLHDHYEVPVSVQFEDDWKVGKACDYKFNETNSCFRSYLDGDGPYINPGYLYASTFKTDETLQSPDILHYAFPAKFIGYFKGAGEMMANAKRYFTIIVQRSHPNNRNGIVKLASADPRDPPYINFHYYEENADKDFEPLVWGIRKALDNIRSTGWSYKQILPPEELQTDAQLTEYIVNSTFGHHACCTNKIGHDNDPSAVLDGKFRVRGVKNLRVVDQSSIPNIFGNFPMLFTYLLGLKAADNILNG